MITICCVCSKVKHSDGWRHVEHVSDDEIPSHGYCPECAAAAHLELQLLRLRDWSLSHNSAVA